MGEIALRPGQNWLLNVKLDRQRAQHVVSAFRWFSSTGITRAHSRPGYWLERRCRQWHRWFRNFAGRLSPTLLSGQQFPPVRRPCAAHRPMPTHCGRPHRIIWGMPRAWRPQKKIPAAGMRNNMHNTKRPGRLYAKFHLQGYKGRRKTVDSVIAVRA